MPLVKTNAGIKDIYRKISDIIFMTIPSDSIFL